MTSKVCVLGSINMDVVVRVDRFPQKGEITSGLSCDFLPGGKEANQAIAIANMGVSLDIIGALGNDEFGKVLRNHLIAAGVNVGTVAQMNSPSGSAIVVVNSKGDDQIVVIFGSNMLFERKTID